MNSLKVSARPTFYGMRSSFPPPATHYQAGDLKPPLLARFQLCLAPPVPQPACQKDLRAVASPPRPFSRGACHGPWRPVLPVVISFPAFHGIPPLRPHEMASCWSNVIIKYRKGAPPRGFFACSQRATEVIGARVHKGSSPLSRRRHPSRGNTRDYYVSQGGTTRAAFLSAFSPEDTAVCPSKEPEVAQGGSAFFRPISWGCIKVYHVGPHSQGGRR
ncbi:MAG: hypothetical protein KatS3mg076_2978 [Candidatus Binatia bacterium]|nr:MAG: hypothetical protein KatS3mg076_2978 [Candidatus Binatia bacterium]